jgi:hypothetical protein
MDFFLQSEEILECFHEKEETPEAHEETPEAHEETPEAHEETPEAHEETPEVHEETPEAHEETPEAHEETPEAHEETPEAHEETPEAHEETPDVSPPPPVAASVPKLIFVVPYRDRINQYHFYIRHMKTFILEDYPEEDYQILIVHQTDNRGFNRGAMKNIGFKYIKDVYPDDYKNMTLVFNDIDIAPINKNLINYETVPGTIKHFYGYDHALGGLFSINAHDFEKINGFPNYWGWGFEDNIINIRALNTKLKIDRSEFYPILDKNFFFIYDKDVRDANKSDMKRAVNNVHEGIDTIYNLNYRYNKDSSLLDVITFDNYYGENPNTRFTYSLNNDPPTLGGLLKKHSRIKKKMNMVF